MPGPKQLQNISVSNRRLNSTNVPLEVVILDANGAQITAFTGGPGGTQYTEGDQDVTITGSALLFEGDSTNDTLNVVSSTRPLPVTTGLPLRSVLLTNVSSGVSSAVDVSAYTRLLFVLTHNNVSSAGTVVLEESDSSNSTLVWSALQTIDVSTMGSSSIKAIHVGSDFAFGHVRARIGSSISTGTIDVVLRAI